MRLLIQRVKNAHVNIEDTTYASIGKGLLVFFAVHKDDVPQTSLYLAKKLINLRIFSDEQNKMNLSLKDTKQELLIVSQFTLYSNCSKGRRPDFIDTAPPAIALKSYQDFISHVENEFGPVQTGKFGANMQVGLVNDGPATFFIEKL